LEAGEILKKNKAQEQKHDEEKKHSLSSVQSPSSGTPRQATA
jgi:hypothetical protein